MTSEITTKLQVALRIAAEESYQRDLVDTGMEKYTIGEGFEYADKADWIALKIDEWLETAGIE